MVEAKIYLLLKTLKTQELDFSHVGNLFWNCFFYYFCTWFLQFVAVGTFIRFLHFCFPVYFSYSVSPLSPIIVLDGCCISRVNQKNIQ